MKEDKILQQLKDLRTEVNNLKKQVILRKITPKNIPMRCSKCNYEWITKTKLDKVSCPNCGLKNEVKR